MKLYLEEKKYALALINVNELLQRFPQNAIFLYYKFSMLLKSVNTKDANLASVQLMNQLQNNQQINSVQIKHFEHLIEEDNKKFNKPKR
jgi:predicted Zn-dependent protease